MFVKRESPLRFISRFSVIHTLTYTIFGIMFMLLSDYFAYFEADELMSLVVSVASGETETKNEMNGCREIAIFKDGVTL